MLNNNKIFNDRLFEEVKLKQWIILQWLLSPDASYKDIKNTISKYNIWDEINMWTLLLSYAE